MYLRNGSLVKGPWCQASQPKFDPQDWHGRRKEWTPEGCPLNTYIINKCNFKNLNQNRLQMFLKLFSTQKKINSYCAIAFHLGNVIQVQSCELAVDNVIKHYTINPSLCPWFPPRCHTNSLLSSCFSSARPLKHLPNREKWKGFFNHFSGNIWLRRRNGA